MRRPPPGKKRARTPEPGSFAFAAAATSRLEGGPFVLSTPPLCRYNQPVVRFVSFLAAALAAVAIACWLLGCAASLGPGYVVETQEIRVSFEAEPQPVIHVAAEYRLTNTGNQPLDSLDVRLP